MRQRMQILMISLIVKAKNHSDLVEDDFEIEGCYASLLQSLASNITITSNYASQNLYDGDETRQSTSDDTFPT